MTGFVGRSRELRALESLLAEARLVSLVGPGGVGKTRLALRAAEQVAGRFPDGVHLVELSALSDPALLPRAVAEAVGLPEQETRTAGDQLADVLADQRTLIVLDTCEHLVEACALLVETLLRRTEAVTVLVTTRQPLDVAGEHTLPVPPLPIDGDAVGLFAQRAAAVVPGFAVTEANREAVTALCRRLDGIPLAIELATVRLRAIPLEGLLARLEDRFTLLTSRRSALPRHQTLRTTIVWSHDLCLPEERLLWARLSVFAGSFDLAAAEAVCAGESLDADQVVECLVGLVDKSVVLRIEEEGGRYHLLDTMREFGAEHLEALGETALVRGRHAAYYAGLAAHFAERAFGPRQIELYGELDRERANLRAALDCEAGLALRLWPYWLCGGQLSEACYRLRRVLAAAPDGVERGWTLAHLAAFLLWHGDHDAAVPYLEELETLAAGLGDSVLSAQTVKVLGTHAMMAGRSA
ncbi:MAG: AAA family ATPase, partial [Nonomuraea sp.]|nr:AAA family ATPase [Nonomuraea sp.]